MPFTVRVCFQTLREGGRKAHEENGGGLIGELGHPGDLRYMEGEQKHEPGCPLDPEQDHTRMKWIFLSYSMPSKPSKFRVQAWRQLKRLGAVNFQTVWAIPHSRDKLQDLEKLVADIRSWKGDAFLVVGKPLTEEDEKRLLAAAVESSNEEYREVLHVAEDFLEEIRSEIEKKNFIFAEVEENEEELAKIKKWLVKIGKRSACEAPLHKETLDKIRLCEKALDDFSQMVFDHVHAKGGA